MADLDEGWRRFWTEDTPIQREFRGEIEPLTAVTREAAEWLDEINRVRRTIKVHRDSLPPIGWSAEYSEPCKTHALFVQSSGGKGAWVLGARHPEIFSALVPMGGFAAVDVVPVLVRSRTPIWALHNSDDWVVGVGNTRDMIARLQQAGGNPKVTIYENSGNGHNCWDQAYDEGALFAWLQAQRLATAAR